MWSVLHRFTWSLKNAYIVVRLLDEARVEHKDRKKNPKGRELIRHKKKETGKVGKEKNHGAKFLLCWWWYVLYGRRR